MKYPSAIWTPSPNHSSRSGVTVDRVVIHQTDGRERLDRAVEHLCNPSPSNGKRVSAHFVVGQAGSGEVAQLVELSRAAWHCSSWNTRSVGIEHVARTPGELGRDDKGLPLAEAQLEASARLVAWLLREFHLSIDDVVPHCSSPTTTHRDCGRAVEDGGIWPWDRYLGLIEAAG